MSWLKSLSESYEMMEYEKGIRGNFTGRVQRHNDWFDNIADSGGQVIRCGKVGRYLLYISIKPFREIQRLKGRVVYLGKAIKKGGDAFISKDMAQKELSEIFNNKVVEYVESKVGIKRPGRISVNSLEKYFGDLLNGLGRVYERMSHKSEILDIGDEGIMAPEGKVEKVLEWGRRECEMASEFFDGLGMPVGKNIPVVVEVDKVGLNFSAGHAVHHQHYISISYLSDKTIIHETAHYMWFYSMDVEMRKILALYFFTKVGKNSVGPSGTNKMAAFSASGSQDYLKDKSKYGGKSVLPSGYSTLNPSELWAEIIKAMSQGKASEEMKRLFRIVVMGGVDDLIKYFNIDPQVAQEYLSGSKVKDMVDAVNVSGEAPKRS